MPHPTDVPGAPMSEHRRWPHWSSVLLSVVAVAVVVVSFLVPDAVSAPVWWALVVVQAASWWYVRRRTRAIAETAAELLDERDLAIRNTAAWWGQTVMFSLGALTALMLMVAGRIDVDDPAGLLERFGGIVLSFLFLSAVVPTVVVSVMTAPDADGDLDPDDDEWDAGGPAVGSHPTDHLTDHPAAGIDRDRPRSRPEGRTGE